MAVIKIKKAQIFRGRTVRANVPRLDAIIRYVAGRGKLGDNDIEVEALFMRTGPNTYRQLDSTEASMVYIWLKNNPEVKHNEMTLTQVEEALHPKPTPKIELPPKLPECIVKEIPNGEV